MKLTIMASSQNNYIFYFEFQSINIKIYTYTYIHPIHKCIQFHMNIREIFL